MVIELHAFLVDLDPERGLVALAEYAVHETLHQRSLPHRERPQHANLVFRHELPGLTR